MAFFLLPLLGWAIAGGAAVAGVAAGVSAKGDFDAAERLNEKARRDFDNAKKSLERQRKQSQKALEELGRQKVLLHRHCLKPFVEIVKRIKNVEDIKASDLQVWEQVGKVAMLDLERTVIEMDEVVGASAEALGAGALAGLAAYGSVGLLGTASTGTAIAGLSGAAATNATLAWLGGGSLAAGGLGMTGGVAVLGGIVAAPVLLVGGLFMKAKAEEALADARSNVKKAKTAAEAMNTARVAARAISKRASDAQNILAKLQDVMDDELLKLRRLVRRRADCRSWSTEEQLLFFKASEVAGVAYTVAEAPLFDKDGVVTKQIRGALKSANEFLRTINAM